MNCPKCDRSLVNLKKPANFCPSCGTKLNEVCEACWQNNAENYNCGQDKCPIPLTDKA